MAMKKAAPKKKASSASGSDRGAKMKADAAQKKSQKKSDGSGYLKGAKKSTAGDLSSVGLLRDNAADPFGSSNYDPGRIRKRAVDQQARRAAKLQNRNQKRK